MKRNMVAFLLAFALVLAGAPAGAGATAIRTAEREAVIVTTDLQAVESAPSGSWTITLDARILANRGDVLAVDLKFPENMAVQEGDSAGRVQEIPVTAQSTATDLDGNAIALSTVMPGQEVRVSFQYSWSSGNPRAAIAQKLIHVELRSKAQHPKSWASVDDFDRGVLVGTVLAKDASKLEVYVESGRMAYGATETFVKGTKIITVPATAVILDGSGSASSFGKIELHQRVAVTVSEASWMESFPPSLSHRLTASRVVMVDRWEKIIAPAELAGAQRMTCTVERTERDSGGEIRLVVRPDEGSRAYKYGRQYTVASTMAPEAVYNSAGAKISIGDIQPGARLSVGYTGLTPPRDGVAGDLPWHNEIRVIG